MNIMNKRLLTFFAIGFLCIVLVSMNASAIKCSLNASLINQDPYPAVPGEYVKLVFQLSGVENPDCGTVRFELVPEYPFSLDAGESAIATIKGGTFVQDYGNYWIIPYRVRVDSDAVDGKNELKVRFSGTGQEAGKQSIFNIEVQDARTDFEVSVKDYDPTSKKVTFEILNIGKNDVEALTVEIPKQESIKLEGANRNIVGSLDSNEDTTFTFQATPKNGVIKMNIIYTDSVDERRVIEKDVVYDSELFSSKDVQKGTSGVVWVLIIVALVLGYFWWRTHRKLKKEKNKSLHN